MKELFHRIGAIFTVALLIFLVGYLGYLMRVI